MIVYLKRSGQPRLYSVHLESALLRMRKIIVDSDAVFTSNSHLETMPNLDSQCILDLTKIEEVWGNSCSTAKNVPTVL